MAKSGYSAKKCKNLVKHPPNQRIYQKLGAYQNDSWFNLKRLLLTG